MSASENKSAMEGSIWHNGALVPYASATVHVLAHGLHYGSAVFEGIRAYDTPSGPQIFRLEDHMRRLMASARIYRMECPYTQETLTDAVHEVMAANALGAAYIRPIIYRGMGGLGLVPKAGTPVEAAVAAFEWGPYLGEGALEEGVDVGISSWSRCAPNTIPAMAKAAGNYLSSQLIAMEAKRLGYTEAIALDGQGYVSEGPGENIFVVYGGVLRTPPLTASILPGLTRDSVITLARAEGMEVREEAIPRELLYLADEIFFTGTAAEITPVRSVDQLVVGEGKRGPWTQRLQERFFGLFCGDCPDRWSWLTPVGQATPKA